MDITGALEYGGFAFAAFVFGVLLIYVLKTGRDFMTTRETFIDRLLTRLEKTEAEHVAVIHSLESLVEGHSAIVESLKQIQITLARLNGARSG